MGGENLWAWLETVEVEKEGEDTNWLLPMWIVQLVFDLVRLPEATTWSVTVMLPKGGGNMETYHFHHQWGDCGENQNA